VARQLNVRFEERLAERTRIARELHDTLFQSFQGVLLKFRAATYMLPDRPAEARKALVTAIEQVREAITEGRDAVQGLRSSTAVVNDLSCAIGALCEELAADYGGEHPPDVRVNVEGTPRDLAPILGDEVYRIAAEALRNAFWHARAARIEVAIRYDRRRFRLRVRDDGQGIGTDALPADGHYGLAGMHERARLVGGTLALWTKRDSGTEAELTIPASVAYAKTAVSSQPAFSDTQRR
jgi:signal transduction histidine kinase